MHRPYLPVFLIALLLAGSCKKEEPTNLIRQIKRVFVSDEIKAWGLFKPGSYWIMRDSTSLSTDSIYVSEISVRQKEVKSRNTIFMVEELVVHLAFKNFYYPSYVLSSYPSDHIYELVRDDLPESYIFDPDSTKIMNVGRGIIKNYSIPDFTMIGVNYGKVRFIHLYHEYDWGSMTTSHLVGYYYWKRNTGLLKWTSLWYNRTSYEMLRCNVSQ